MGALLAHRAELVQKQHHDTRGQQMIQRWAQLISVMVCFSVAGAIMPSATLSASLTVSDLVGTWDGFLGRESLVFKEDGTVTFISPGVNDLSGAYEITKEGVSLTFQNKKDVAPLQFAAERLVLNPSSPASVFSKAPEVRQQISVKCSVASGKIIFDVPKASIIIMERGRSFDINGTEAPRGVSLGTWPTAECTGFYRSAEEINQDLQMLGKADRAPNDGRLFEVTSIKLLRN